MRGAAEVGSHIVIWCDSHRATLAHVLMAPSLKLIELIAVAGCRPVLIGTTSVNESEEVRQALLDFCRWACPLLLPPHALPAGSRSRISGHAPQQWLPAGLPQCAYHARGCTWKTALCPSLPCKPALTVLIPAVCCWNRTYLLPALRLLARTDCLTSGVHD